MEDYGSLDGLRRENEALIRNNTDLKNENKTLRNHNTELREQIETKGKAKTFKLNAVNVFLVFLVGVSGIVATIVGTLWVAGKSDNPTEPTAETTSQITTIQQARAMLSDGYYEGIEIEGGSYTGYLEDGIRNGYGTIVYVEGNSDCTYEGNWVDDKRTGQGKAKEINNKNGVEYHYEGGWLNNKYHGKGKMEFIPGDWYDGDWVNGKKDGYGIYYFAKGQYSYIGGWKDDKRHGKGREVTESGKYSEAEWDNGKQIIEFKHYNADGTPRQW